EGLGWPRFLKAKRQNGAVDVYQAICALEKKRGLGNGALVRTSLRQLAEEAQRTNVRPALHALVAEELIDWNIGTGSGPHAKDRMPSEIRRSVPIPTPVSAAKATKRRTKPNNTAKTHYHAIRTGVPWTPMYMGVLETLDSWPLESELAQLARFQDWLWPESGHSQTLLSPALLAATPEHREERK